MLRSNNIEADLLQDSMRAVKPLINRAHKAAFKCALCVFLAFTLTVSGVPAASIEYALASDTYQALEAQGESSGAGEGSGSASDGGSGTSADAGSAGSLSGSDSEGGSGSGSSDQGSAGEGGSGTGSDGSGSGSGSGSGDSGSGDEGGDSGSGDSGSGSDSGDSGDQDSGDDSGKTDPVDPDDPDNPDPVDPDDPDDPDAHVLVSAALYYQTADMEEPVAYESPILTPLAINERQGSFVLDVMLTYKDGTQILASKTDVEIEWTLTTEKSKKILKVEKNEETKLYEAIALGAGNGTARIHAKIEGLEEGTFTPFETEKSTVAVRVTENDESVTPVNMELLYTDWLTSSGSSQTYNSSEPPSIVMYYGSQTTINLKPQIAWSDGSVKGAGQGSYSFTYSVDYFTDLDGNSVSTTLASVSSDGVVSAQTKTESGYAYITIRAASSAEGQQEFSQQIRIAVYSNQKYVKSLEIVDDELKGIGAGTILEDGINLMQLYAKVTYLYYNTDTAKQEEYVTYSAIEDIEGLTWGVYRGDTSDEELYSSISEDGLFRALTGFNQARVEACITGGGYFGQDFRTSIRITREVDESSIGRSMSLNVKIYHESDYERLGDDAPVAYEQTVSYNQLAQLGNPYYDWFTFRNKKGWATVYAYGISITSFLHLVGINSSDLLYMEFKGSDGYVATDGFYSADTILSTQYRYSNYYMRAVSTNPSYLGRQNVAPMLALSYYVDWGNDYISGNYKNMRYDGTIRIFMGMGEYLGYDSYGKVNDSNNAAKSVSRIGEIILIIEDQPDEETSGGEGGGGGESGGGSGSDTGSATQGASGGLGTGGDNSSVDKMARGGVLRELTPTEELIIEQAVLDNPWDIPAIILAILALVSGMTYMCVRFRRQTKQN
jgi:hypothetical protein